MGIAGGTGSGKTTLAKALHEYFSDSSVLITQDSYYKDLSHLLPDQRNIVNFDHPNSLDFELSKAHLIQLKQGQSIEKPEYNFVSHTQVDTVEIISVKNQYLSTVKPIHNEFVEQSKNHADVVLWGVKENLSVVTGIISSYLQYSSSDNESLNL